MIQLSYCSVDMDKGFVIRDQQTVSLSSMELKLLAYFLERPNQVVSRETLLDRVWGYKPDVKTRTDYATVLRLRGKIEQNPSDPEHLIAVHGVGYRFEWTPRASAESLELLDDTNISAPPDRFIGRKSTLENIRTLLMGDTWLLTLKGFGGIGKTRLAKEYAWQQVVGGHMSEVWFCDLCAALDTTDILNVVASTLGLTLTGSSETANATHIGHAITGRERLLLILDNAEQISGPLRKLILHWRSIAPEATWLVTSRRALSITGEQVFEISPLPVPKQLDAQAVLSSPAGQLFAIRAASVHSEFRITDDNAAEIGTIVDTLDGMPLAIELAAARVRILSPKQILAHLSDRFKLLKRKQTPQSDRHKALRTMIDWSWDLLDPAGQAALAHLSVFRGGCSLEAAEAVLVIPEDEWTLDVIENLIDNSLLHRAETVRDHVRYHMLDSIQAYADEKLGSKRHAVALRHARFFSSLGETYVVDALDVQQHISQIRQNQLELENLQTAVDVSLAQGEHEIAALCGIAAAAVYQLTGPFSDGIQLLERFSDVPVRQEIRGRIHHQLAWLLQISGRGDASLLHFKNALSIFKGAQRSKEAEVLGCIAFHHREHGRIDEARSFYEQAINIHEEMGDRGGMGNVLGSFGHIHRDQGDTQAALACFQEALAIHKDVQNRNGEALNLGNIAIVYHENGQIEDAAEHYEAALTIHRDLGNLRNEGIILGNLAILHQVQGNISDGLTLAHEALAIHRQTGHRRNEAIVLGQIGRLLKDKEEFHDAERHYQKALTIHRDVGNRRWEGITLGNLGDLLIIQNEYEDAAPLLMKAIQINDDLFPAAASAFRASLALIRTHQGDVEKAHALLNESEQMLRGSNRYRLADFLCKKARICFSRGERKEAEEALQEAELIAQAYSAGPYSELGRALTAARMARKSP